MELAEEETTNIVCGWFTDSISVIKVKNWWNNIFPQLLFIMKLTEEDIERLQQQTQISLRMIYRLDFYYQGE